MVEHLFYDRIGDLDIDWGWGTKQVTLPNNQVVSMPQFRTGCVVASRYSSLAQACAAASGRTLLLDEPFTVSAALSVPADVALFPVQGCTLAPASGVTLTINGPVLAGDYAIFGGAGTVTVSQARQKLRAMWWVTDGDGSESDPYTGWDTGVVAHSGPVEFSSGFFQTAGVLKNGGALWWQGMGMNDSSHINPSSGGLLEYKTRIIGDGSAGDYLLKCTASRYVCLRDLTLDGNGQKSRTLNIDGASVSGCHLANLVMLGATQDTFALAETSATQVDQSIFTNVFLLSAGVSRSQFYINSTNAIHITFDHGGTGGSGPYGIYLAEGNITLRDFVMSGATTADIHMAAETCLLRADNVHSESNGSFLTGPAATPATYPSRAHMLSGINHTGAAPAAHSIIFAQTRPLMLKSCLFAEDVEINSPATCFVEGPIEFAAGKAFTGTGDVSWPMSVNDPMTLDHSGATSPHLLTNRLGIGTALTTDMVNGTLYLPNQRGINWTRPGGAAFGSSFVAQSLYDLADDATAAIGSATTALPNGIAHVYDLTDQTFGMFSLHGANNTTALLLDPSSAYDNADTDTKTCVIYNGSDSYILRNRRGAAHSYLVYVFAGNA
jgi:hypothetical protein